MLQYRHHYGHSFDQREPDYDNCAAHVYHEYGALFAQCQRSARRDYDFVVVDGERRAQPTACYQHAEGVDNPEALLEVAAD